MIGRQFKFSIILILAIASLNACMNNPTNNALNRNAASEVNNNDNTFTDPIFEADDEMYWFTGDIKVPDILTLNENIATVIFLKGRIIHEYLKQETNMDNVYCMVINFNTTNAKKQMRMRAAPLKHNNIIEGTQEYYLRLDIAEEGQNTNACGGTINSVANADAAFYPISLCQNCTTVVPSTSMNLYTSNSGITDSDLISEHYLKFSSLTLRIDVHSVTTDPAITCTNQYCQSINYDCCSEGYCVNNGQLKPHGPYESDYNDATAHVATRPLDFVFWPNIYYICTNVPLPTPEPSPEEDVDAISEAEFEQRKKNYYCLKGAVESTPDYSNCNLSPDYSSPGDKNDYLYVKYYIYNICGCEATTDLDTVCPNYGLQIEYASDGTTISDIICDITVTDTESTPIQDLEFHVSNRSVPHKFYDETGTNHDEITGTQEGDEFFYLDEVNKIGPQNGPDGSSSFNVNSVLGSMSAELDKTLPAKIFNVKYGHAYVISAYQGTYFACPLCTKDSWSSTLTGYPDSTYGNGTNPFNYTTARNSNYHNYSNGNYEDTIFGRACFVPLTMIPFSHKKETDLQTQRQNRLKTQTAYYMNGYQRDWYGFNRGALIGSFDGVSWFAIGNGRRVRATSSKLHLAINAPFADLASPGYVTLSIIPDAGNNTAPDYDWNSDLHYTHPEQNKAASCQAFHQCSTDADCITQLGWEYVCANVSKYKTHWPKFDNNGNELVDQQLDVAYFSTDDQIIKKFHNGSNYRCVYRGAGAPCKQNYSSNLDEKYQKMFTCAPNFYCANASSNAFNDQIAREPNNVELFYFGQEGNFLGRPLDYVAATEKLASSIINNIRDNATLISSNDYADFGLCRPGKRLNYSRLIQHQSKDSSSRTDFISQISSCNSTTELQEESCPVLGDDPDDEDTYMNYILNVGQFAQIYNQNSCGNKALNNAGDSAFKYIEALPIPRLANMQSEMLVRDACLRRAGSICHSDLDCTPNRLHASQTYVFDREYFGNTEAELFYWQEELVCGQAASIPYQSSPNYHDYDLTKNRCCRKIGKKVTLYTEGNTTIIPDLGTANSGLTTDRFPTDYPTTDGRYSRYSIQAPFSYDSAKPYVSSNVTPAPNQWKTIHDSAQKTCCGGGWIRMFSDSSHDWTNHSRLSFDVSTFQCLNYESVGGAQVALRGSDDYELEIPGCPNTGGNAMYYLTKLGRLELLGIPQIFYEPIYCNTNRLLIIDDIFDFTSSLAVDFNASSETFSSTANILTSIYDSALTAADSCANAGEYITYQNFVQKGAIFSGHEFLCCLKLGSVTNNPSECCSNYLLQDNEGKKFCGLPSGTDLHVYFNRFVSGEGSIIPPENSTSKADDGTEAEEGLTDDDFILETGEPKLRATTYAKIERLGKAYCVARNIRDGAAIGNFHEESLEGVPNDTRIFGIIDSPFDIGDEPNADTLRGTLKFNEGYRWNHHYYCQ